MEGNDTQRAHRPARDRLFAACLVGLMMLGCADASEVQSPDIPQDYSITAGTLEDALNQLARQSKIQIVFPPELVTGKRAPALSARLTWREALDRLLQGTGLTYGQVAERTIVIRRGEGAQSVASPAATSPASAVLSPDVTDIEAMMVTGTRIRGGSTSSPVTTIGAENIREEGFTDLGQVIRSVSQNFAGGQNPGVASGAVSGAGGLANQNITGGSSLNLRGLGPDATLTLLNGRRMSYGGFFQSVDISAIPVEAVERLEIVSDGASAIYGSDAVGGVGNVILKRDYTGVTVSALSGRATDGGLSSREYTATAGATWASGGFIATYKYASVDPIYASQRDYTAQMVSPTTIYPGSDLRSALVSAHQSLGNAVELKLDALRTEREQRYYSYYSGVSSYYNRFSPETTTTLVAPSVEVAFTNDWALSFGAAIGRDERVQHEWMTFPGSGETLPSANNCYCNESRTFEVGAEGPLFALAGGDARLAVGAGYRKNEFAQHNYLYETIAMQGEEGSRFAYAELNLPLIGPGRMPAVQRLTLTAAVRGEDYDSFGSVATPKLGLIYSPTADYTAKVSWGRSFKAPTLFQRYQSQDAVLYPAIVFGGSADPDVTVLSTFGGNPNLEPERARTWTASLAIHPQALPDFEAELTWFDLDYTDRVVQPISNYAEALTNPIYGPFVDWSPTPDEQAQIIATTAGFYNYTEGDYDPASVVALLYTHYVNVARQRVRGIDLSGSYRWDIGAGRLTLRGSGSWLDSSQQNSPADSEYDLSGTLYSPAKINGRAGVVWLQGGFTASAFANYTSGVTNTVDRTKTASFTTVDLNVRYSIDGRAGPQAGWDFALSAHNLFDRPPPLHRAADPTWVPYDSTNYSAIGRFVSFSVARRW